MCSCSIKRYHQTVEENLELLISSKEKDPSVEKLIKNVFSPRVVFLPVERDLTPVALSYEMIRSMGMPPESRNDGEDHWYDLAVVDGQFLHFILYLIHKKLLKYFDEVADVMNIAQVLQKKLCHKETCLNIMGWVLRERRQTAKAVECYQMSLLLEPDHNDAFWHLLFTLAEGLAQKDVV